MSRKILVLGMVQEVPESRAIRMVERGLATFADGPSPPPNAPPEKPAVPKPTPAIEPEPEAKTSEAPETADKPPVAETADKPKGKARKK
jgi:hypothetical protein